MCSGLGCTKFFNVVLSLTGIGLSAYSFYIETKFRQDENYVPMCDIDEKINCSAVFSSPYAQGFGVVGEYLGDEKHPANQPNCVYGLVFYTLMFLLSLVNWRFFATLQILLSLGACAVSGYLGYLLYFVIEKLCIVCVATYAVNFLLLVFSVCKRRACSRVPKPLKEDKYGYYIPTTTNPVNNNFKKYI